MRTGAVDLRIAISQLGDQVAELDKKIGQWLNDMPQHEDLEPDQLNELGEAMGEIEFNISRLHRNIS